MERPNIGSNVHRSRVFGKESSEALVDVFRQERNEGGLRKGCMSSKAFLKEERE